MKKGFGPHIEEGFLGERIVRLKNSIIEFYKNKVEFNELFLLQIGYYPQARFHYFKRTNYEYNYFVLLYIVKGKGFCDTQRQKIELNTGDLIILPPHQAHEYYSDLENPWTIYWCHYRGTLALSLSNTNFPLHINTDKQSRISNRILLFEEMIKVLTNSTNYEDLAYCNACLHHFLASIKYLHIYRHVNDSKVDKQATLSQCAIHFMNENLYKNLSIIEIATYCGYSKSRFMTLFKKETGITPIYYFNQTKIKLACSYLKRGKIKNNQLCYKIGIDNPAYFSRLFKKHVGCSPDEYRKRHQKDFSQE